MHAEPGHRRASVRRRGLVRPPRNRSYRGPAGGQPEPGNGDIFPRLKLIWADSKYHNYDLYEYMQGRVNRKLEIVKRPEGAKGFILLPRRWVTERTYAWIGRYRANSKDYERCNKSSEGMVYAAMTRLMLNRLRPGPPGPPFRYR
ncbi:MAG: transposase, partial [Fimbriiglobus sp.]